MGQGANGGAGQGAGNNRFVKFTRPAAQRIAAAVRQVEGGNRDQPPFGFEHPQGIGPNVKLFRIATFTGAWAKNSVKTVTFKYTTATPNTAVASNLFFPVTGTAGGDCGIAKEGTAWFLIDVPLFTATAVFVRTTSSATIVQDVTLSAALDPNDCTIVIGKTLTTTSVVVVQSTYTSTFVTLST
jgi:hypothetical protein